MLGRKRGVASQKNFKAIAEGRGEGKMERERETGRKGRKGPCHRRKDI